jgi:hypothetical protein
VKNRPNAEMSGTIVRINILVVSLDMGQPPVGVRERHRLDLARPGP